jgi:hypothetical protein
MAKKNRNKSGQAVVEYVLVLSVMVVIVIWGLGYIKCSLHTLWINMACDIIEPYPKSQSPQPPAYCEPVKQCFDLGG